jgi:hypothetical protein
MPVELHQKPVIIYTINKHNWPEYHLKYFLFYRVHISDINFQEKPEPKIF